MKPFFKLDYFALLFFLAAFASINAQNTSDTRLLHSPAVSDNHIAFVYAEDLWIADKDGSNPRRLTIDEGVESLPVFSPDGSQIAFNAQYDGNTDVYVIPSSGGIPKRLTWHPAPDQVLDFTPDGKNVLFSSQRHTFVNRWSQLYTVGTTGGTIEKLPIPTAWNASYSSNGRYIAYTPLYEPFGQWKNYRGGTQTRIWVYNVRNNEVVEIPKPAAGSNDTDPQWMGNKVYFRSDRDGEFNLYSYDNGNKKLEKLTDYKDFPVEHLKTNGNDLIFEQGGYIHLFDTKSGKSSKVTVGIATDLLELRPRYVSGTNYIRWGSLSPSGSRVVVDFRGEIVTVPAEKGDVNNLSMTPGVHEKYPEWSPDGKHIAFFSDESGEYALHLRAVKDGSVKKVALDGAGFYAYPHWSPDSKKICFSDNSRSLYIYDTEAGSTSKIASDVYYTPGAFRELFGSWSFDSKWVAYTLVTETNFERAYLYSTDENKSYPLSDGLSNVTEPTFDPSGKYIYMFASTNAGPVVNWFDQSNQDMQMSQSIYLVTLQKDLMSPLAKENDEEEIEEEDKKKEEKDSLLTVDWEGIDQRIISLPISSGMYSNMSVPKEGQVYFLSRNPQGGFGPQSLMKFDFQSRKANEIGKASAYWISAKGNKMLYQRGPTFGMVGLGKKLQGGTVNIGAIKIKIDPVKEWANIFNETWRVNRDYFYDPGMHGADWPAMKKKYEVFLKDVSCKSDLYRVMRWMCSELAVGHHRFNSSGDRMNSPDYVGGGLLGADYEIVNNRYQIKKIYGGLNWTPNLRSPLTEPGVNVSEGEYIIAVNGQEVRGDQNIYRFFENTAGKIVRLKVSSNADGTKAREVKVVPVNYDGNLRNRDWVEGNMKKVHEATDGQVAYVYVPNTTTAGHTYFKRYFFPQADKKAVIIDERFNGGGQLADYYVDMLKKPYQSHWNFRYGKDLKAPSASIQGPKVMLIDETSASGGDYLPWLFRRNEVGTIIGKRTWGGLVGVLGYPELIDGGIVTAPNVAFYAEEGFRIENEGVAPDIEVEQWPKEMMQGKDPQLEKAIEVILEQLKENTPTYPKRPDYPVRVNK
ncbi:MAG: PDZ domain-containing protein [Bacteroidota bacterium]